MNPVFSSPSAARLCPICGAAELQRLIAFDDIPATGVYSPEATRDVPRRRLEFGYCTYCAAVIQLTAPDAAIDYAQVTRPTARQLPDYVDAIIERAADIGRQGGLVVEVGCNDGALLDRLCVAGCSRRLGIEPSTALAALAAKRHAVTAMALTRETAAEIVAHHGHADALICRHTLEHVPDARRFLDAIRTLLKTGGRLCLEVPSLAPIIERLHVHELWDEHVSYFLPGNLVALLGACGFADIEAVIEPLRDSDSIICHARAAEPIASGFGADTRDIQLCASFAARWQRRAQRLRHAMVHLPHPVVALGASHPQANFLNFSGLAADVDCAIDDDSAKIGKWLSLSTKQVPIFPSAELARRTNGGTLLLTAFGYPEWMDGARSAVIGNAIHVLDMTTSSPGDVSDDLLVPEQ